MDVYALEAAEESWSATTCDCKAQRGCRSFSCGRAGTGMPNYSRRGAKLALGPAPHLFEEEGGGRREPKRDGAAAAAAAGESTDGVLPSARAAPSAWVMATRRASRTSKKVEAARGLLGWGAGGVRLPVRGGARTAPSAVTDAESPRALSAEAHEDDAVRAQHARARRGGAGARRDERARRSACPTALATQRWTGTRTPWPWRTRGLRSRAPSSATTATASSRRPRGCGRPRPCRRAASMHALRE